MLWYLSWGYGISKVIHYGDPGAVTAAGLAALFSGFCVISYKMRPYRFQSDSNLESPDSPGSEEENMEGPFILGKTDCPRDMSLK